MTKFGIRCVFIILSVCLLIACSWFSHTPVPARLTPSLPSTSTLTPKATATLTPVPTALSSVTPSPRAEPAASPTPSPTSSPTPLPGPGLDVTGVHFLPWPLYVGDYVSIDVDPRMPEDVQVPLTLTLALSSNKVFTTEVAPMGLDAQYQARWYWAWEVPSPAGALPLTFTLWLPPDVSDPDLSDNVLPLVLSIYDTEALLPPEPHAQWVYTDTLGFRLHYLTGTAAARDISTIVAEAEAAYADVTAYFGAPDARVDIYLMDRVIGQGGYASSEWVAVTYTDRMYAPVGLGNVLRHELTHRLDTAIGCDQAPSLIREGLAVYVAGGHYRSESLVDKVAAILQAGHYITVEALLTDFYVHQHEVSYAEAGAWVAYVVDTFGWESVQSVCLGASEVQGNAEQRLVAGLHTLGIENLADFERAWLAWVAEQGTGDPRTLEAELWLMELMRAYQLQYDPGAHFLEGILFSPAEAARREIEANFIRRPREPEPVALELLLMMAQEALRDLDIQRVDIVLDVLAGVLVGDGFQAPLAADVLEIVQTSLEMGYEPYRLEYQAEDVYKIAVLDLTAWPSRDVLFASWDGQQWYVRPITLTSP